MRVVKGSTYQMRTVVICVSPVSLCCISHSLSSIAIAIAAREKESNPARVLSEPLCFAYIWQTAASVLI